MMFESLEIGRRVSKEVFREREQELRVELLDLQRQVREGGAPVLVLISGVEGAGKASVLHRLLEWLDPRGVATHAFWDETDDERDRPFYWRFWRRLPGKGGITFMFGSWYTQPIIDRVFRRNGKAEFERALVRIREFEKLLTDDGARVAKLWFHLSARAQRRRLESDVKAGLHGRPWLKAFTRRYERFAMVSQQAIHFTDTGNCPWHLIEATDARYRDLAAGLVLRDCLRAALSADRRPAEEVEPEPDDIGEQETLLDRVDLSRALTRPLYERRLRKVQRRLGRLAWQAREVGLNTVAVFEGWDAAGKGGAIRRLTFALDPRLYQVIAVAAPTDEERAHHYLWRFWRQIPRGGCFTIYDRSWYGRVLVERVEGFARPAEWRRAYREINEFEDQLAEFGTVVLKFWLHLSPDEQLARFREREQTPWKMHKITDEDWRNRERWDDYAQAVHEMVMRTNTPACPWHLVPANDKKYARIEVLETTAQAIEAALDARRG